MRLTDQVSMYCNLFNVSRAYAEQSFKDMAEFIKYATSMGYTVKLPGVLTIEVREQKPQRYLDFQEEKWKVSEAKMVPKVKVGNQLREAVINAPNLPESQR